MAFGFKVFVWFGEVKVQMKPWLFQALKCLT
jgi:hypothetical protein